MYTALKDGVSESMQHLVDHECQIFRDLGVDECELEGQRRKLALSGNEERWIEHL